MFDLGWSELLVIAIVAILVVGPKELPRFVKTVSEWFGKMRRMASHFQAGVDEMIRQSELDDLRKDLQALKRETSRPILPPGNPILHTTPPPSKMVATSATEIVDASGSGPQPAPVPETEAARVYIEPPPPPAPEPQVEPEPAKSA